MLCVYIAIAATIAEMVLGFRLPHLVKALLHGSRQLMPLLLPVICVVEEPAKPAKRVQKEPMPPMRMANLSLRTVAKDEQPGTTVKWVDLAMTEVARKEIVACVFNGGLVLVCSNTVKQPLDWLRDLMRAELASGLTEKKDGAELARVKAYTLAELMGNGVRFGAPGKTGFVQLACGRTTLEAAKLIAQELEELKLAGTQLTYIDVAASDNVPQRSVCMWAVRPEGQRLYVTGRWAGVPTGGYIEVDNECKFILLPNA